MHIVHINFSITMGGIDTMLVDIMNEQVCSNKTTLVVINDNIDPLVLKKLDPRVAVVRVGRLPGTKNPLSVLKLNILLNRLKPSIVHCHNSRIHKLILKKHCPFVVTVHDIGYTDEAYPLFERIIAISEAVKEDVVSKGSYSPVVIHNGINSKMIFSRKNRFSKNTFKIIMISRLEHHKKGQDLLIESVLYLKKKHLSINVKLDFFGEGESRGYLEGLIFKNKLDGDVVLRGNKSREYIYKHLCDYDLLVQPSRYEGFGLTVVEAMLAKVPVLVSNSGGPMEIIDHGRFGYYFESDNSDDLADQLNLIYKKIEREDVQHDKMINNAFSHAYELFSISKTVDLYEKEYKSAIREFSR